ncbi:VCBS repeat-containing protein [soil metagenome]
MMDIVNIISCKFTKGWIFFLSLGFLIGCEFKKEATLFTKLSPDQTGIHFENTIEKSIDFNILHYPFFYNGGGVAIGDINNNGLPDIFLTGNMVSSRLYMNKGNMEFVDITEAAGVTTDKWITGVSMVDINNNGYLDIYLSVVSQENAPPDERENLLFINNGVSGNGSGDNVPTFTESAKKYGINDDSFTTHAVFLDYNRNGYLDLFLLNHSPGHFARDRSVRTQSPSFLRLSSSHDKLYKNNGDGTFTDVSEKAGILKQLGYGLGVVVADFNRNGWPDIYVSNDISPNDVLYINNQDGTFTNKAPEYLKHTSFAGMGVDAADFNNDGWPDILQVDMMPENIHDRKVMSGGISYDHFQGIRDQGFDYYYSKNSLQLSNGIDQNGNIIFSEIGRLDNIAFTDWSWGALFGDYNNSGLKDILITNGYPKPVNKYDYQVAMNEARAFGTEEIIRERRYNIMNELEGIKEPNYFFRNDGNLRFSNVSEQWGFTDKTYSYGVAHADLNNNGSLDVVINNINAPTSVYKNNAGSLYPNNYVMVELKGNETNRQGIGAEVILTSASQKQHVYHTTWRGYQSTVDHRIHFGLGETNRIDSLEVIWPDGNYQLLIEPEPNQILKLEYGDATKNKPANCVSGQEKFRRFSEITTESGLHYQHKESQFVDYNVQSLLPYQLSKLGPKLAVGDVTGNGLDDVFVGGSAGYEGTLLLQNEDGTFSETVFGQTWNADRQAEDSGAAFFDANGNGMLDLYVTSGGYEFSPASELLQDRLYINMGDGRFVKDEAALPRMLSSTSVVTAGDFNDNGKLDLFVGGRMVPGAYPRAPRSYILQNNGGTFSDVTSQAAPELREPGMITDAVWIDFDNDGQLDLVTTGIWLPVQFYKNENGRLRDVTQSLDLPAMRGWWYSIEKGDFNNNGYTDLIAGNLGLNFNYKTSEEVKFGLFANDFNKNMVTDIIFTVEEEGLHYPFYGKPKLGRELGFINDRFLTFESFSKASLGRIFQSELINHSVHLQADTFASLYLQNNGDGSFSAHELPTASQFSAIKGVIAHDVNQNGILDLIIAGNIYKTEPETPRNDASNGLWMKGDGNGNFEPVSPFESGFLAPLDVKDIKLINTRSGKSVLVANNSDSLQVFRLNDEPTPKSLF